MSAGETSGQLQAESPLQHVGAPDSVRTALPGSKAKSKPPKLDAVLRHRWARLLIPSLSDLFFLACMGWLFMGAYGWLGLLADGDVGWHIRTGEWVLAHRSVPQHDLYSFSKPGADWYAWEWGSDVLLALLYQAGGLKAVVLSAGVLIALFCTALVRRTVQAGSHVFVALGVALLGVGSASIHFLARPHVLTLVLLSGSVWMMEKQRRGELGFEWLWALVPVSLLWTNLHGGFLVLIAVLGLACAGSVVEALLGAEDMTASLQVLRFRLSRAGQSEELPWRRRISFQLWNSAVRYGALSGACALVTLVNPYGWGLHQHVLAYLKSDWIKDVVQEFQSPSFHHENMMQFEVLLFSGLMAASACFKRKRVVEGLWILFFAYEALTSARHVPIFVAVLLPVIGAEITSWWTYWTVNASKGSLPGILNLMSRDLNPGFLRNSVWPVVFVAALIGMNQPIKWPKDFPAELFPIQMVHQHEQQILHSRLLTVDQWADYLIFLHPEQKVFVDGRSDFYGPEVGNQALRVMAGGRDWQQIMDRYQFNLALIPAEAGLAQLLRREPAWRLIADDGKHVLFAKR